MRYDATQVIEKLKENDIYLTNMIVDLEMQLSDMDKSLQDELKQYDDLINSIKKILSEGEFLHYKTEKWSWKHFKKIVVDTEICLTVYTTQSLDNLLKNMNDVVINIMDNRISYKRHVVYKSDQVTNFSSSAETILHINGHDVYIYGIKNKRQFRHHRGYGDKITLIQDKIKILEKIYLENEYLMRMVSKCVDSHIELTSELHTSLFLYNQSEILESVK